MSEQPTTPLVPATEQPATEPSATEPSATEPPAAVPSGPAVPPPAPGVAPYDPAQVWAVPPVLLPPVRRDRRWVRTALRWTAAAVVCAVVGTGTAFGVMAPKRTDVPGLKTPADSRYVFPQLALPPLPPKASTPEQGQTTLGHPEHAADLRKLLLPAPLGAKVQSSFLPDASGWYPVSSYLNDFGSNDQLRSELNDYAVRHIAAESWTTADGVRTQVYLLGFRSDGDASFVYLEDTTDIRPAGATSMSTDSTIGFEGLLPATQTQSLVQPVGPGRPAIRVGLINLGEVEAVVVMSSPKTVPLLNFRQVVSLQGELLQG